MKSTAATQRSVRRIKPVARASTSALETWRTNVGYQLGMVGFARFSNILRLWRFVLQIHPRFVLRAGLISVTSLAIAPLNWYERIRFGKRIESEIIRESPVFIIGHWRSGTTHLHNLMARDERFATVSMFQALMPECSLVSRRWLAPIMAKIVPLKRPMDNMQWPMDAPQEEEIPLAKMYPYAFYTQFLFPKRTIEFFRRFVLLEGASQKLTAELKTVFKRLLKIASLHGDGKRLLLKNPVNTARIPLLLELFPDAKFVYIHRCPHEVFRSTRSLHRKLHVFTALQPMETEAAQSTILELYELLMHSYLKHRDLIPEGNLVEVRFDGLEADPLGELERIYDRLSLASFAEARDRVEQYVSSQRDYQKNQFSASTEDMALVEQRWRFAFEAFGYGARSGIDETKTARESGLTEASAS
ncbi:MAG: sulfotransferase [Gammaproteobacteria bacterium]|nr:sulfotransferase [Gammaproteobacteria bacterium]